MIIILLRVIIIYLFVLFYLRVMGKRQLGEMQPFELVVTLIIADIATLPMTQTSMPLLFSLIPLTAIVVLHFFVSFIARKSISLRRVINGKPVIVISPNGIEFNALKELNMNLDDLFQGLRMCNYYKIADIQYAIVETNGQMTVIPKSESSAVIAQDLNIQNEPASLPLNIITAGKIIGENLKLAGIDQDFINNILNKCNLKNNKEVLILTLDANGSVYIQPFKGQPQEIQTEYSGGGKW